MRCENAWSFQQQHLQFALNTLLVVAERTVKACWDFSRSSSLWLYNLSWFPFAHRWSESLLQDSMPHTRMSGEGESVCAQRGGTQIEKKEPVNLPLEGQRTTLVPKGKIRPPTQWQRFGDVFIIFYYWNKLQEENEWQMNRASLFTLISLVLPAWECVCPRDPSWVSQASYVHCGNCLGGVATLPYSVEFIISKCHCYCCCCRRCCCCCRWRCSRSESSERRRSEQMGGSRR